MNPFKEYVVARAPCCFARPLRACELPVLPASVATTTTYLYTAEAESRQKRNNQTQMQDGPFIVSIHKI
jgi:hypothetical protein